MAENQSLLLTDEERERFASWCEQQAFADANLALQMDRIQAPDALKKQYEANAAAYRRVAQIIRTTEKTSIGGDKP